MPRGLSSGIKAALAATVQTLPIYCVRIRRNDGTYLRYAEQSVTFNDGLGSNAYTARLAGIDGMQFAPDEAGPILIRLINVDGAITVLDRTESFLGGSCDVLAYLPSIADYYIPWSGFCDEISELTPELAHLTVYPSLANPHVMLPKRVCGAPCSHVFGNLEQFVNYKDFDGSECPYQYDSTRGFVTVLNDAGGISDADVTFTVTKLADSRRFRAGDEIKMTKVATPGAPTPTPSGSGGTLASATYYYKISALNSSGETAAGTEASAVVTGPTGSVSITWAAITGATKYRIYRGTASDAQDRYFESTTASYTDIGSTPIAYRLTQPTTTAYREIMLVTSAAAPGATTQSITVTRAWRSTAAIAHSDGADVAFRNCRYSTEACLDRGMYGNNPSDTYAPDSRSRNYFGGFPIVTGFQAGFFRTSKGGKANPARVDFSGNESAYGRSLPLVYGKVRIADPTLMVVHPEGDFLTALFLVAEGLLATNTTNDDQTTEENAYVGGPTDPHIYINGVSRHDPRPGYGIQLANGRMDDVEPDAVFFPSTTDFTSNRLGFWGTAWFTLRINTKNNPAIDLKGQNISASCEIAYGRVVRQYSDTVTFTRKATTNPAWALMDMMTSKRAGGGMDISRLNIQSFIDVAAYNDTLVYDTFVADGATQVNRWTFNGVIDERKSYQEWIHLACAGMYCLPPFLDKDGKLKIKSLGSVTLSGLPIFSSKVASATTRNILWENSHSSLVKSRRPVTEIPNEVRVVFVDKVTFTRVSVLISDRESQMELGKKLGDQSRRTVSKGIDLIGTSTLDEAARIGTLFLRAGEFGQGGLSNNCRVTFKAFHRDVEDIEIGDVIEVEDDLLNPALNEQYFRVTRISAEPTAVGEGFDFVREVEAVLHANAIYDDTSLTVSKFDRIAPPSPSDQEPPAVTGFSITETGALDGNGNPVSLLTINYTEPIPKENFRSVVLWRSNDDGLGDPVGDWRFVGEVLVPGETIEVENSNTYQHFAAVSRTLSGHVPDVDTEKADGTYKYPRVLILVDGYTDTSTAEAPVIGVVRSQGQWGEARYEMTVGVDVPLVAPTYWKSIYQTEIQISSDGTFATFPAGESLNSIYNWIPPNSVEFSTNVPGTYYLRARVYNAQGPGAWSATLTRSTHFLDNVSADSELIAAPTPTLANISGTEFDVEFTIPTGETATYYGYSIYGHSSSTLPTATTQETGTAGSVTAGISKLTDATKAWTVNQWAGKDIVLFDTHRGGTPTFDYEGMFIVCEIISNTATEITFNAPVSQVRRTMTGMAYYVVNRGANHHFWEKLTFTTAMIVDEEITTSDPSDVPGTQDRSFHMSASVADLYVWVACYNAFGQGEVTASPAHFTYGGSATGRIDLMAITDGRDVGSIFQQRALLATNENGFVHIRTGTNGQAQYADSITGRFLNLSVPGVQRATDFEGTDAGQKIAAAIAMLPATGGIVDARGLTGDNTVTSGTITVGSSTKPIILWLPCGRIISAANPVFRVEGGSWLVGSTMGLASGGIGGTGIVATGTGATAVLFLAHGGGLSSLTISLGANALYGILMNAAVSGTSILDNEITNIRLAGPTSASGSKAIYMIAVDATQLISFCNFKNIRITDFHTGIVMDSGGSPPTQGPTNNWFQGVRVNGTSTAASIAGLQIVRGDVNTFIDSYFSLCATGVLLDGGVKNKFYALDSEGPNTLDLDITTGASMTEIWGIHSENNAITDNGLNSLIITSNSAIATRLPRAVRFGDAAAGAPSGLPAAAGTNLWIAGGYGSPVAGRIYAGDGSGFYAAMAKRTGSTDTDLAIFKDSGAVEITGGSAPSLKVGASGTAMLEIRKYTINITPGDVASGSVEEETFTCSGLSTADTIIACNGPTPSASAGIVNVRASAANTVAISWVNPTPDAAAPVAGNYIIVAMRH